jgi:hypothetical protein
LRQHALNYNFGRTQGADVAEANIDTLTADEQKAVRLLAGQMRRGSSPPVERPKPARGPSAAELRVEASRLETENTRLRQRADERDRHERSEALHRWLRGDE